jgi:hypothetical protein
VGTEGAPAHIEEQPRHAAALRVTADPTARASSCRRNGCATSTCGQHNTVVSSKVRVQGVSQNAIDVQLRDMNADGQDADADQAGKLETRLRAAFRL